MGPREYNMLGIIDARGNRGIGVRGVAGYMKYEFHGTTQKDIESILWMDLVKQMRRGRVEEFQRGKARMLRLTEKGRKAYILEMNKRCAHWPVKGAAE